MKKLIRLVGLLVLLAGGIKPSYSQNLPLITQFMPNQLPFNPGFAGSIDLFSATMIHRRQWAGLETPPTTTFLSAHSPLRNPMLAAGFTLMNDRWGGQETTELMGSYAYRIPNPNGVFSFGISGGVQIFSYTANNLLLTQQNDPLFPKMDYSQAAPNFSAGMYYYTHLFSFGFSIPRLLEHRINPFGPTISKIGRNFHSSISQIFPLFNHFDIRLSGQVRGQVGAPLQFDGGLAFLISKIVYVGSSIRGRADVASGYVQVFLPNGLNVGFAQDFTINKLPTQTGNILEFFVGYDLVDRSEQREEAERKKIKY